MVFSYPNRVYWCDNCNVPLLSNSECPLCGHPSKDARLGKGEIKPIFDLEKEWYSELLISEGFDPERYLPGGMCFYYRGSIVVDGKKIFRLTYDEADDEWGINFYKKFLESPDVLVGSTKKLVLEANSGLLEDIEQDSQVICQNVFDQYQGMPHAISFSGGKDSVVTLDIVRKFQPDIPVIYMNTTIDFPETVDFVHELAESWNLNLYEVTPHRDFFSMCEDLGPPSKYMKWCCKTSKFAPMNGFIDEHFDNKVLVASGIRRNESNSRSEFDFVQVNKKVPKQILFFPILKWNSLMVWLYHLSKNLPINPAYMLGYSRIGCLICPEKTPRDLSKVRRTHSDLFNKFEGILRSYAKINDYTDIEGWIKLNKWRFRVTKYDKQFIKTNNLCSIENNVIYNIINNKNQNKEIMEFMKVFGPVEKKNKISHIKNHHLNLSIIGNKIRVKYKNESAKHNFEHQLEKAMNCIGCGACIGTCERGAIYIQNNKFRISDNCTHCLKCLNNGLRKGCIALNYKTDQLLLK